MTTALEREEAPPVSTDTGGTARTIDLTRLAAVREARYHDRVAQHRADPNLDPRVLADYEDRTIVRIDDVLDLFGMARDSRAKLTKIAGGDRLPIGVIDGGNVTVDVLFWAGGMPAIDFILNHNPGGGDLITVRRIIPGWFRGTIIEWGLKDHRLLFDTTTGLYLPHQFRIGRPPEGKNRLK